MNLKNEPLSVDLFQAIDLAGASAASGSLSSEARKELMDLAKRLRAAADSIDLITKMKTKKSTDELGEPTFRFAAKVTIPDDFKLTLMLTKYGLERGFDLPAQEKMLEAFVTFYRKGGKKWQDWGRVWMDWVRREADKRSKAPKTRATTASMAKW